MMLELEIFLELDRSVMGPAYWYIV